VRGMNQNKTQMEKPRTTRIVYKKGLWEREESKQNSQTFSILAYLIKKPLKKSFLIYNPCSLRFLRMNQKQIAKTEKPRTTRTTRITF
jgi:hypothetical protein